MVINNRFIEEKSLAVLLLCSLIGASTTLAQTGEEASIQQRVIDIAPPDGSVRVEVAEGSFGAWLRNLPLKPDTAKVRLYDGRPKNYQGGNFRVIDLDIGITDLQQCADAVIRLRAEYLFSARRINDIAFTFTSGDRAPFPRWTQGWRPEVNGDSVSWRRRATVDSSYANLRRYLNTVFQYCGSYSLARELEKVSDINQITPGDCFIQGGFPGHVIIVVDCAVDSASGAKAVLLAQSYMPAQDIHILRNLGYERLYPWYWVGQGDQLETPEWTFEWSDLYRFPDSVK